MTSDLSPDAGAAITPAAAALRLSIDAGRLAGELMRVSRADWRGQSAYEDTGPTEPTLLDWTVLPLRSPGGSEHRTDPGWAGVEPFLDTRYLDEVPYTASVLASIPTELRSVRYMALGPGTEVGRHRDRCGFEYGSVRLHVPVVTNPDAVLTIDGQPQRWQPGTLWFGDFSRWHSLSNHGATRRVHLVIDALVTDGLLDLFPAEFARLLARRGDVVRCRPRVDPEPVGDWTVEVRLPPWFVEGWADTDDLAQAMAGTGDDLAATLTADGSRLVLGTAARPLAALVPIGDSTFRLEGWTDQRTIRLDAGTPPERAELRYRWEDRCWAIERALSPRAGLT